VGNFSLLVNKLGNFYFFMLIIIIVIGILLSLFTGDEEKESSENKPREKKKLFGKIDVGMIFFVALNAILIGLIIFSLYGSLTFYQMGADPAQDVTIRGIYPDLQYYSSFKVSYNYISNPSFSQGFLTYAINSSVSDSVHSGVRPGVPAFSWMQALLLILLLYDLWTVIKFLGLDKKLGIGAKTQNLQPKAL
jgi:magnesium-transporting ATPase (P-type)